MDGPGGKILERCERGALLENWCSAETTRLLLLLLLSPTPNVARPEHADVLARYAGPAERRAPSFLEPDLYLLLQSVVVRGARAPGVRRGATRTGADRLMRRPRRSPARATTRRRCGRCRAICGRDWILFRTIYCMRWCSEPSRGRSWSPPAVRAGRPLYGGLRVAATCCPRPASGPHRRPWRDSSGRAFSPACCPSGAPVPRSPALPDSRVA